jgi:cysteine desulfurase/selenocysteine lyase
VENIGEELLRQRGVLVPALLERGWQVVHPSSPREASSAITSFHRPGADLVSLHQNLIKAGIYTSLRTDRAGRNYIRVSPHFYNTQAELQRLLELV